MPELADGQSVEIRGSARAPYVLKNVGGVYSCSCPAWRNQSLPIERRTCKHLRQFRGADAEAARVGGASPTVRAASHVPRQTPALLLAETWDGEQQVRDWWISEKLDGVRAYWTGERFLSRQGNVFHAPAWFRVDLPPFSAEVLSQEPCRSVAHLHAELERVIQLGGEGLMLRQPASPYVAGRSVRQITKEFCP